MDNNNLLNPPKKKMLELDIFGYRVHYAVLVLVAMYAWLYSTYGGAQMAREGSSSAWSLAKVERSIDELKYLLHSSSS